MIKPFTSEEVEIAVKSLKNNKSAGNDNIYAEQLKCSPNEYISDIFNNMAETGVFPSESKEGTLIPLHKPGKEKGKVENVRPIILLTMIRKILAIIIISRLYDKLDSKFQLLKLLIDLGEAQQKMYLQ